MADAEPPWAQVVETACRNAMQAAREFREAVRDEADLRDTTGVELVPGGSAGRSRSMTLVKAVKRSFAECGRSATPPRMRCAHRQAALLTSWVPTIIQQGVWTSAARSCARVASACQEELL